MGKKIPELKFSDVLDRQSPFPIPVLDIVIFTVYRGNLCLVMLKKEIGGKLCYILPGGVIRSGYNLSKNFDSILERKTGIKGVYKEQLYTFGDPERDERGHTLSIAYYALVGVNKFLHDVDFTKVALVKYSELTKTNVGYDDIKIGLDHLAIISYAKQRLKWKLEYTNVAKDMLPNEFRISQLQEVYEIVLGVKIDKRNFQKKIFKLNMVEETGGKDKTTNRPAKLYKFRDKELKVYEVI